MSATAMNTISAGAGGAILIEAQRPDNRETGVRPVRTRHCKQTVAAT